MRAAGWAGACACALFLAACGGGSKQDADEPSSTFRVQVVRASFPHAQSIARPENMVLTVRNAGLRAVPNLAITINSFSWFSHFPELASRERPVWVVERGAGVVASRPVETEEVSLPGSGETAYVNTWAFGSLAPGATRTMIWRVVPVRPGVWTVDYEVAAGLAGQAKAFAVHGSLSSKGRYPRGRFLVRIAPAPKLTHVNPNTGKVEQGQFPSTP